MTNDIALNIALRTTSFPSVLHSILSDPAVGARRVNFSGGRTVFDATSRADTVYFIVHGQVRLYQVAPDGPSNRLCEILGPDEWFGVGALAGDEEQGVRAVTVGPTQIVRVDVERFLAALARHPQAMIEFNRELAGKLRGAWEDAAELIFRDTNARLINMLLRFSRSAASTQRDDGVVLNITHSQLAQAVGAARETVSLALTQLRHQKLVRTGRNQLFFNPELLSRSRQSDELESVA